MRKEMCRFFTGTQNGECDKGVVYKELVGGEPGWALLLPCMLLERSYENKIGCEYYSPYTEAEEKEREERLKESMSGMMAAIAIIQEKHPEIDPDFNPEMGDKKGAAGTIECPVCQGVLHYTVAAGNNHIWGKCETDNCLGWMM